MKLSRTLLAGLLATFLVTPVFANSTTTHSNSQTSAIQTTADNESSTSKTDANKSGDEHKKSDEHKDKSASLASPVNINTASVADLTVLKGVGEKRAEAIIQYRETNGKFASIDDLTKVHGISQKWINKNRTNLTTGQTNAG